jgi:hypothetical protein
VKLIEWVIVSIRFAGKVKKTEHLYRRLYMCGNLEEMQRPATRLGHDGEAAAAAGESGTGRAATRPEGHRACGGRGRETS